MQTSTKPIHGKNKNTPIPRTSAKPLNRFNWAEAHIFQTWFVADYWRLIGGFPRPTDRRPFAGALRVFPTEPLGWLDRFPETNPSMRCSRVGSDSDALISPEGITGLPPVLTIPHVQRCSGTSKLYSILLTLSYWRDLSRECSGSSSSGRIGISIARHSSLPNDDVIEWGGEIRLTSQLHPLIDALEN